MGFTRRSTAEEVTEGLDLSGKTAVITGVNSGLGLESMRVLASRGARVIGLARTKAKADAACDSVTGNTVGLACELSDLESVRNCVDAINDLDTPIDILMTNAGIMAPMELSVANDVEMQFATNHLGHFVLIEGLRPLVEQARGRIVILSSTAHTMTVSGGIDFENLDGSVSYDPWRFYGQSKLANLLHARELARRLEGTGVTVNALHPGVIRTNLGRDAGGFLVKVMSLLAPLIEKTVPQGAATQCYVATHPDVEGVSGEYFSDCKVKRSSAWGRDDELARELWLESERLAAGYIP
ncbi:MAG: SDR family oxidoreductase [Halieaceae bacterium]